MIEDKSYGIIPICRTDGEEFLLVKHKAGHWSFPKGHKGGNETDQEAASRELQEETGITDCSILNTPQIIEEYNFTHEGKVYHKIVKYFIGLTIDKSVKMQESEIVDFKWVNYENALKLATYENTRQTLKRLKNFVIPI